jgi:hypothetical protein
MLCPAKQPGVPQLASFLELLRNLRAQPGTLPNNDSRCGSQHSILVLCVFVR